MAGEDSKQQLPGYVDLPSSGDPYSPVVHSSSVITAVRMTGDFLVRGPQAVQHIKDGYLCKAADGSMFGLEKADFEQKYLYYPNNPPANLIYGIYFLNTMQEGVALTDYVVTAPAKPGPVAPSSLAKTGGTLPDGITFDGSTLVGTPGAGMGGEPYAFELQATWDDGSTSLHHYTFFCLEP